MALNSFCTIHDIEMEERTSKTKFNDDGTPKTYFAHIANGTMCFGEGMGKAVRKGTYPRATGYSGPVQATVSTPNDFTAPKKDWGEASNRQSLAQTAYNNAAQITASMVTIGLISTVEEAKEHYFSLANEAFEEINETKESR